jgi:hypothetical protein
MYARPFEQLYDGRVSSEEYPLVKQWNGRYFEWVETEPDACPNGHPWGPAGSMRRGYLSCTEHDGHRIWTCVTCGVEVLNPPHEGDRPRF